MVGWEVYLPFLPCYSIEALDSNGRRYDSNAPRPPRERNNQSKHRFLVAGRSIRESSSIPSPYGVSAFKTRIDTNETQSYTGGNPNVSKADALPGIREWIFQNGTGNVSALLGEFPHYGSYQVLANLTVDLRDIAQDVAGYRRSLDLRTGVYADRFCVTPGDRCVEREAFCSYPDGVCVYRLVSNTSLLAVEVKLENRLAVPAPDVACEGNSISLYGRTFPVIGMRYNARATVVVPGLKRNLCAQSQSAVRVPEGQKEIVVVVAAGTDYDVSKGNAAAGFSFRGKDPYDDVLKTASKSARKPYAKLKSAHVKDFQSIFDGFTLTLPDPDNSASKPTTDLITSYTQPGNPYVENLLFDYGRYLFLSSSRPGSLPPNLQGLWTEQYSPAWSADYHANINLQMNHWGVEQTGLGGQTEPLWTYILETWLPRGAETARLLYGAEGWVTHDEMNIFGHTA